MTYGQDIVLHIKGLCAIVGAFFGMFFGVFDDLFKALIIFICIDYITGVICAIVERKLSSEIGAKGIAKKVFIIILVGIANLIDTTVIKSGEAVRDMVIFFYLANEGISILENSARMGLPIPEKLKDILEQLKDKDDK